MRLPDAIPAGNVYAGTVGGTVLSVFGSLMVADLMKTAILAAVGAVVSFLVSVAMKALFKKSQRHPSD